ncbi:MAG: hypothetical protein KTR30_35385, partial [Saprospiraceae bacterium]|nr:hypothetical protein [Saprospiraceae bacterium]
SLAIDPNDFEVSPPDSIKVGMHVLHMKFGKGEVKSIDGARDKKVATIRFDGINNPEKRIMLRFAKLQITEA